MTTLFDRAIESDLANYIRLAKHWFGVRLTDRDAFETRLRAGFGFGQRDPHAENRIECSRHLGMFSLELFQAMMCGGKSYKPAIVLIMWERLRAAGAVFKTMAVYQGVAFADHQIIEPVLYGHIADDTFANLFATPARLPERYAGAIAAIDVVKGGDNHRGTAFVVRHDRQQYLVTAKHNVDPADDVRITAVTTEMGLDLEVESITLSAEYDIAIARLARAVTGPCFALSDHVELFDEVFTLGYPLVPRAESILLGHRGEMNGRAKLYMERCPALIISNLVSPGSSGGPVLTRDGRCVGMTINWLEGERGRQRNQIEKPATDETDGCSSTERDETGIERMRFSAALPSELVRDLIVQVAADAAIS